MDSSTATVVMNRLGERSQQRYLLFGLATL